MMVRDYQRKKIKSYDYDQLSNLANDFAALKKKTSIRKFAKAKGIPYATAQRWIKQPPTKKPGHPTILTKEEENLLATALKFLGDANMGQDRDDLANMVQAFIRTTHRPNPFHDGKPGIDWIRGFEKRHPEISQRTGEILTVARAKSLTPETVNIFFDKFEKILDDNQATNLRNQPGRIWNADETGLGTNPKANKLYSRRGRKMCICWLQTAVKPHTRFLSVDRQPVIFFHPSQSIRENTFTSSGCKVRVYIFPEI